MMRELVWETGDTSGLVPFAKAADQFGVRVGKIEPGAVARRAARRNLERRPDDRRREGGGGGAARKRDRHLLIRLERRRRHDLRADNRQVDERRRLARDL